jgi:hypothetical protein
MSEKITPAIVNLFVARMIAAHTQMAVSVGASQSLQFPIDAMDMIERAVFDAFDEFEKHGKWAGLVEDKADG